jgi:broad specificity phosphatase PhoE
MNVYLFRHGDVANPDGVLYGRLPGFHLEEEGKVTIRASAKSLADKNVHKIYTSPLERATETSKIIGETLGLNDDHIIINDALIETDCRSWEGKPLDDFLSHSDYAVDIETQTSVEPIVDSGQRLLNFSTIVLKARHHSKKCFFLNPIAHTRRS